jgi:hypothetical protein
MLVTQSKMFRQLSTLLAMAAAALATSEVVFPHRFQSTDVERESVRTDKGLLG